MQTQPITREALYARLDAAMEPAQDNPSLDEVGLVTDAVLAVLAEFQVEVEGSYFRTHEDTGANPNALFVWNRFRDFLGQPQWTQRDLKVKARDGYLESAQKAVEQGNEEWADRYRRTADTLTIEMVAEDQKAERRAEQSPR